MSENPRRKKAPSRNWTSELVISEIQRIHSEGHPINSDYMVKNFPAVQTASRKIFGNYNNALDAAGFDHRKIKLAWKRPKEEYLKAIRELHAKGEPLNSSYQEQKDRTLWESIRRNFGGWYEGLEAAGLNPDDFRRDRDTDFYFGHLFERLMCQVLSVCGGYLTHAQQVVDRCQPDFTFENNVWMDVKLSSWTTFDRKCKTIDKYTPHCSKLIIVYLRGNDIKHPNPKVEMRNVVFYYPQLEALGRRDLIDKIEDLRQQVEVKAG